MDWYRVQSLKDDVVLVTEPFVDPYFSANMHLVRGRDADILIDSGMGIVPLRTSLPLGAGKPVIAFATHIHLDHVGALHEFEERVGPIYSAPDFATMPDEKTYAHEYRDLEQPVLSPPALDWSVHDYRLRPAPLTRAVGEGDVIDLGGRLMKVLHLPGHSPDSIALLDEVDGLLFSGDAIYDDVLLDGLPDSDVADYRTTMQRILDLPVRRGFGGHGPHFSGERMRTIASAYLKRTG